MLELDRKFGGKPRVFKESCEPFVLYEYGLMDEEEESPNLKKFIYITRSLNEIRTIQVS